MGRSLTGPGQCFSLRRGPAHLDVRIPLGFVEITGEWFPRAAIPESVIALVLAAGAGAIFAAPRKAWWAAVIAQVFADVGVQIGLFTIAIGIGPQTVPDVVFPRGSLTERHLDA